MATAYSNNPVVKGNLEWARGFDKDMESKDKEVVRKLEIRKGQAINAALAVAIKMDKVNDTRYFFKEYLRHLQQITLLQKSKIETLVIALDNPEFIHLLNNVDEHFNYLKEDIK